MAVENVYGLCKQNFAAVGKLAFGNASDGGVFVHWVDRPEPSAFLDDTPKSLEDVSHRLAYVFAAVGGEQNKSVALRPIENRVGEVFPYRG